ncbi:hypothetical protein PV10_04433 [Exophiala mesophila]|uniref:Transcription initiation factor TFIID subunit 1 histone acetyltransferase domain-containing protein n=1 Tax=Exophiala mesophila TaxID=212818 RepID=A0A0D1XY87_EXOME|nr:uncharacterized protein PV10_04433 [Exophiala mesophila]KIV93196.1 hypothetical protein PV10_04433 [Exophiala mesophila]
MESDPYQQANGLDDLFDDDDDLVQDSAVATPFDDSFAMPASANADADNELSMLMNEGGAAEGFDLNELNDRALEVGEKADDAIDFEDFGDDESLPDEEGVSTQPQPGPISDQLPGIEDSNLDDLDEDDLFGDLSPVMTTHEPSKAFPPPAKPAETPQPTADNDDDLASDNENEATQDISMLDADVDEVEDAQYRIQLALFAQSGKGYAPTTEQENIDEWLKLEFPNFKRDEAPYFNKLFPPRPHKWPAKVPLKPPRPIRPTKVTLDLEPDQRTAFNSAIAPTVPETLENIVNTKAPVVKESAEESSDESDDDELLPNGLTLRDLEFMCTDFDTLSHISPSDDEAFEIRPRIVDSDDDLFNEFDDVEHPRKKRRLGMNPHEIVSIHEIAIPSFDNPERKTASLATKVVLDLNDPQLLVEEVDPEAVKVKVRPGEKAPLVKTLKDRLQQRFKTSNDAEYDLLKQNHQHKVRGQLTSIQVSHSVPAVRLQYPYYQVRLSLQELRNYHRKKLHFKHNITFSSIDRKKKRKHMKNKKVEEIYKETKDLSLSDLSTPLFLEYSEEHPLMMSQIGMGNKVIHYYRRRTKDDSSRPKPEIGEASVLLPEDKSPFYIFGQIDPGETITALYNSMYRAPIFEQESKSTDFLVVRESNGIEGQKYYMRALDNVYVVGQELPTTTIPGTHSRVVTTNAKNRLKAISYRIARKKKSHRLRVEDVTRHFPDTTDMQNRQKMKEFMVFSKEHKEWEMKPGETLPDEDAIQNMIKPEEICLLESMQVGAQYLQDSGFADNDDDDDKENDNDSIEQQLAPWRTTKNFIQATQGKAMLKLFGEGDPSGRGEAFSFIKTSMKGGFRPIGGSAQDAIALKKELGGHSYNVARQQKSYEESIRGIWDKQKASLGSKIEPSDLDMDGDVDNQEDRYNERSNPRATPMSGTHTPAPYRRRDDETATSISRRSINSLGQTNKTLKIVRTKIVDGEEVQEVHFETSPAVIKQYLRIKEMEEAAATSLADIAPTGDPEKDARQRRRQANLPWSMWRSLNANQVTESKKRLLNSKRTPPAASKERRTRMPLPRHPLVEQHCHLTRMPPLEARIHNRLCANVQTVVKWAISKPTKSQSNAKIAISPLIAKSVP